MANNSENRKTVVDNVVNILDSSMKLIINDWKLNDDMSLNPIEISALNFDDSHWKEFKLKNEDVFQYGCWLRKVITIPDKILGNDVIGRLNFFISINDTGELWCNGKSLGRWQWDKTFQLTSDVTAGDKITLLIKGNSNHPMYLFWLSDAYLILEKDEKIKALTDNLLLSFRTIQKLLSDDTYQKIAKLKQDNRIDKSSLDKKKKKKLLKSLQQLAGRIDIDSLQKGDYEKYLQSIENIRKHLKPFIEFAKQFTIYFVANAHIDAAWLWREKEVVEVCKRTFSSALKLMDIKKDMTFVQSSAAYYEWMEKYHPELFRGIMEKIAQGQWEIAGGMWVEPDCNLPDGESWVKQFQYAQDYFLKKFGKKAKVGINPDSFGFNWNLPQFFNYAGIENFVTTKLNMNDTHIFPYRLFWWEAPDGSRVLTYLPNEYMDKIDDPFNFIDFLRQFEANTGFRQVLFLFGIGDHGGGPSLEMLNRIERLRDIWIFPNIEFTTLEKYFALLRKQDLSNLPVWNDELYLEYHRATYTTQAKTKALNRKNEIFLPNVEKLSVFAQNNEPEIMKKAWKNVLFNQFHDILPGTSIHSVYHDVYERYDEAAKLAQYVGDKSAQRIIKNINTEILPEGKPIVIFNLLSWNRSNYVFIRLPDGVGNDYIIVNDNGEEIPSQIIVENEIERKILFKANIPSMGYAVYGLKKQSPKKYESSIKRSENLLENKYIRIDYDNLSGWITQIVDKKNKRELLTADSNRLQLFGNKVRLWKAWNINYTGESFESVLRGKGEIIEDGPIRTVLRFKRDFLKPGERKPYPTEDFPNSFFIQDIILYEDADYVEFRTVVDWWEDEIILKTAFSFKIDSLNPVYEIPYGSITRSSDLQKEENKAKYEVSAIRWADLSEKDYGIALINDSKYGYDTNDNVMRLTLLNSPLWPDPLANRGKNDILYWLYPHKGDWKKSLVKRKAYEFNNPLLLFFTTKHSGTLPIRHSFVKVEPKNVIVSTISFAKEDKNDIIFHCYEWEGKNTNVKLSLDRKISAVSVINLCEEEKRRIKFKDNEIDFTIVAYQIMLLKIKY